MTKEKNKLLCRWFHGWTLVKNERAFVSNYFNPHFCPYYYYYLFFYFLTWVKNTWDHLVSSPFSVAYQTMENTSFVSTFFFPLFPSATFQFSLQPTNCLIFFYWFLNDVAPCTPSYLIFKKKKLTWNEISLLIMQIVLLEMKRVHFGPIQFIIVYFGPLQSIQFTLV